MSKSVVRMQLLGTEIWSEYHFNTCSIKMRCIYFQKKDCNISDSTCNVTIQKSITEEWNLKVDTTFYTQEKCIHFAARKLILH